MNTNFISMPAMTLLDTNPINYLDLLTYFTIKSFLRPGEEHCYPPYSLIAFRMGTTVEFVKKSIKRLIKAYVLEIITCESCGSKLYQFPEIEYKMVMIPTTILSSPLTCEERAFLIACKLLCHDSHIDVFDSLHVILEELSFNIDKQFEVVNTLITKGYLDYCPSKNKDKWDSYRLTNLIDWLTEENDYLYLLKNQIQRHSLAA